MIREVRDETGLHIPQRDVMTDVATVGRRYRPSTACGLYFQAAVVGAELPPGLPAVQGRALVIAAKWEKLLRPSSWPFSG